MDAWDVARQTDTVTATNKITQSDAERRRLAGAVAAGPYGMVIVTHGAEFFYFFIFIFIWGGGITEGMASTRALSWFRLRSFCSSTRSWVETERDSYQYHE